MHATPLLSVAVFALLASSTTAQSTNGTNSNETCSVDISHINSDSPVNSTGQVKFNIGTLKDPWYWSVAINGSDIREVGQAYLSVPEDSDQEICISRFAGQNKTSSGPGMNGCEGILSQACFEALTATSQISGNVVELEGKHRCSNNFQTQRVQEACGEHVLRGGIISTTYTTSLTNHTCSPDSPPGVEIPDDYRTFFGSPGHWVPPSSIDNDTLYDLFTRQSTPYVISVAFANQSQQANSTVVCVAPNNFKEGSRVPQGQLEENTSSQKTFSSWLAMVVSFVVLIVVF